MNSVFLRVFLSWTLLVLFLGCGVKSDPLPPGTPAQIGRGKPKFEGAAQEMRRPRLTPIQKKSEETDESDE